MKYIVKLFPEITIKSKPVRKRFIQRLQSNLQVTLRRIDDDIRVSLFWDKLEVVLPEEKLEHAAAVCDCMSKSPGIQSFIEVVEYTLGTFHEAYEHAFDAYKEKIAGKTFKVRVKRSGKHEFKSIDLERYIGGGLLEHGESLGVDVRKPEVFVDLEVRDQKLFVFNRIYPGLGGYPLGTQEPVLSLISGGFDSVVSSYMTMRRGSKTHFLFFNLGGKAHEMGVEQVALHLWQQYGSCARVKFVSVPFSEVVGDILQNVHHSYMGVVLKRQMMRAAEKVADYMKIDALVTGESIAQVSSQTLPNLAVIDRSTTKVIIRPLITTDKQEIVDRTKALGCFDLVASIPEYCGVISDRPTTRAKLEKVEAEEENLDMDIIDRALEQVHTSRIDDIVKNLAAKAEIDILSKVSENQKIVDIRAPHEQEKKPLNMPGCEILITPFYELEAQMEHWSDEFEYLLYCEKGVMSQLHAHSLQEKGVLNVKVFRPQ